MPYMVPNIFVNNASGNSVMSINTLRPRQNCCHFADNMFKYLFLDENEWISHRISLKFVPGVWINNIPALVQKMAWHRPADTPLSEPMMVSLLTHICVTRPLWVKQLKASKTPDWTVEYEIMLLGQIPFSTNSKMIMNFNPQFQNDYHSRPISHKIQYQNNIGRCRETSL